MLKKPENKTFILLYHRIVSDQHVIDGNTDPFQLKVSECNFANQMEFVKKIFHVISLEDFVVQVHEQYNPSRNQVVITFDDGYVDNFHYAYPILIKFNLSATIFITTDNVSFNKPFWIDRLFRIVFSDELEKNDMNSIYKFFSRFFNYTKRKRFFYLRDKIRKMDTIEREVLLSSFESIMGMRKADADNFSRPLTWRQICEMQERGISFGSHTCSHPILTRLSLEDATKEINCSKKVIESNLNRRISLFAYPYGEANSFNNSIKDILKKEGYKCACSTELGTNKVSADLFELKRIPIRNWGLGKFEKNINKFL